MKRFIEKRYLIRQHILPLIAVSLTFYFAYHLMQGQRSYPRLVALQNQTETLEKKLADLEQDRHMLHARVQKMRLSSLDHDLLHEQARAILGLRHSGEVDLVFK